MKRTNKSTNDRSMSLESLEDRRHMSVSAIWDPSTFALRIDGDANANTIVVDAVNSDKGVSVTGDGATVTIRNSVTNAVVNAATLRVEKVLIYTYEGNDRITINKARDSYVRAGEGNDTIYGANSSAHSDKIYGGAGNDTVAGRFGDDILYGDNYSEYSDDGHDLILGSEGNDTLYGCGGEDTLWGHGGNDFLWGGSHADELTGGNGIDHMYGQSGNDWIDSMDGNYNEYVSGGTGRDSYVYDWFTLWFVDDIQFDDADF